MQTNIPAFFRRIYQKLLDLLVYVKSKGFFDLLSVNFLTQFLSFGSILLVAKFLSPTELGEVKIIQSYIGIFSILAGFGFNTAVLKICAENRSEEDKAGVLNLALKYSAVTTMLTIVLVIILAVYGNITTSSTLSFWLIIYSISIPFQGVTTIFIVYLQAQKRIKEMAYSQAIIKVQSVLLVIICTWLWKFPGFVISTVVAYIVGLWPLLRLIGIKFLKSKVTPATSLLVRFGFFSFLANGIYQLGQFSDVFILDHFSKNRIGIGYYALGLIFFTAASQVTSTVQSITTPYFSQHSDDRNWFRRQLFLNQERLVILSIIIALGVFILAKVFIPLIYGPAYAETLTFLPILLLKYVIWSSCAVISTALVGLGLMHYNFIVVAIVTPVSFLLSYLFFQKMGIAGVAWAQVIATLIMMILVFLSARIAWARHFKPLPEPIVGSQS